MKTKLVVMVFATLAAVGCGSSGDDSAANGANAFSAPGAQAGSTGGTLKDQMTACKAVEDKAGDAESTADMVQAEGNIRDCYSKALASHAAEIDAIRKKNGGIQIAPANATAAAYFDDYRKNQGTGAAAPTALCDIGHAASSNFGGTLQRVEDAGCEANIEIRMTKLVASEADLPGGATPLTSADGTADQLHALVPKVVAAMIANTPGDEAATTADVTKTVDGAIAASNDLCGLLEDAGQMGGGTGAHDLAKACAAKAIGLLVTEMQTWVDNGDGDR